MQKNFIFPIILILAVTTIVGLFVFLINAKNAPPPESTMIFFYKDGCPHCENVEDFFAANQIESKISFEKREAFNSATNAEIMADRFKKCNITDPEQMGFPLLWDGSTCTVGDEPIIDYFKSKLGI